MSVINSDVIPTIKLTQSLNFAFVTNFHLDNGWHQMKKYFKEKIFIISVFHFTVFTFLKIFEV